MNLIQSKGALGFRGHAILCVLVGLLFSEASSRPGDSPEEEVALLKLKLDLLSIKYRDLCKQYSNMAHNYSAPVISCSTECPDKWLHVGDQCFFLATDKWDWSKSAEKCKEIGSHLAILTTREQHEAVEKEGKRIGGIYTHYWIGLTDAESEGNWTWVDKSELNNAFWSVTPSEPDNNQTGGAEGEDCAVVDSYTHSWYDVPCSFTYPRICQMDATPLV
ncbi:C-type lectin domain family 4 member E-like [Chelmon rostratus]|uniref:C-type lectin domain family 4 member E-like n=1 Tax=Chelmon rostratus TaxID=109905 RepID=UPI001BE99CFE|nr:C-type lectin domain family 4 member E-like [Chelmon rostratus]